MNEKEMLKALMLLKLKNAWNLEGNESIITQVNGKKVEVYYFCERDYFYIQADIFVDNHLVVSTEYDLQAMFTELSIWFDMDFEKLEKCL